MGFICTAHGDQGRYATCCAPCEGPDETPPRGGIRCAGCGESIYEVGPGNWAHGSDGSLTCERVSDAALATVGPEGYARPETITPAMGWQSCRYVYDGTDPEDGDYYHCLTHRTPEGEYPLTLGHEVSCEYAGDDES